MIYMLILDENAMILRKKSSMLKSINIQLEICKNKGHFSFIRFLGVVLMSSL